MRSFKKRISVPISKAAVRSGRKPALVSNAVLVTEAGNVPKPKTRSVSNGSVSLPVAAQLVRTCAYDIAFGNLIISDKIVLKPIDG